MKKVLIKTFKIFLAVFTITFCINSNIQAYIKNIFFKLPLFAGYHSSATEKSAARKKLLQLLQKKNDLENALEVNTSIVKKNSIQKNLNIIKYAIYKQEIIIGNRWSTLRKLFWSTLGILGFTAIGFVGYQEWMSKVNKIIKQKHKKGNLARQNQQLQQKLTSTKQKKTNLKKEIFDLITLNPPKQLKGKLTHIDKFTYHKYGTITPEIANSQSLLTIAFNVEKNKITSNNITCWVKSDTSFELKNILQRQLWLLYITVTRDTLLKTSLFVLRRQDPITQVWSNIGIFDPSEVKKLFKN